MAIKFILIIFILKIWKIIKDYKGLFIAKIYYVKFLLVLYIIFKERYNCCL